MSLMKYEEARKLIAKVGGGDFEGPKPESLVASAEAALGVKFPPSYRRFLLEFGCGDINGFEIFGLIDGNFQKSTIPNGIWLTLDERRSIGLKPSYIIVGESGDGAYCVIDTSQSDLSGESPVIRLSVDRTSSELISRSFGDYFFDEINRRGG